MGLVLVLSVAITAGARPAPTGSAEAAIAVGEAQVGKPFQYGAEGPDAFSCVGLMRYILRTSGVDAEAPWVPEEYLSAYAPVAPDDLQPGDIVIYPDWATMYVGDGMVLNSNEVDGQVTYTPMSAVGEPLGIVRPPYTP
jgi:cell wall-associated NlpC family hydrolase